MYNGIGLVTPRGSGTSGHVQANKFNVRRAPVPRFGEDGPGSRGGPDVGRKPNQEILDHARKRQLEVKLFEYRVELEDAGCVCVQFFCCCCAAAAPALSSLLAAQGSSAPLLVCPRDTSSCFPLHAHRRPSTCSAASAARAPPRPCLPVPDDSPF
jgi:serine/arginine repetitive matrix protein 2